MSPSALLLAPMLLLAGCGGSGTGEVNSAGSTATTTGYNSTLQTTLVSERFAGYGTKLATSGGAATGQTTAYGTMAIAYNASTNSYTLSDASSAATTVFAPANKVAGTAAFNRYVSGNDSLSLLVNSAANPRINLSYITYGLWTQTSGGTTTYRTVLAGIPTPYGNVPKTGSATYSGIADGVWSDGTTVRRLLGSTGSVTANFETGAVAATLVLSGTADLSDAGGGTAVALGTYTGAGSITAGTNLFAGTLAPSTTEAANASYSGSYNGMFYGPGAQEAGLSFQMQSNNSAGVVNGVLATKR